MEFHGNVQGRLLQDYGMPGIADELRDYHIDAYVIGSHIIKANLSPSPRARHPYYMTSFEKVPGTPVGNGLVDMIADLQDVANATLRSLVNNLSISSGPMVVINDDRVRPEDNVEELYPWKRFHASSDPVGNNSKPPVEFFQPQSNAQDLLTVFKAFVDLADDISAIPKYIGGQPGGGAGRTASGLAMLMNNAAKILQTVASNVDREIFEGALQQLVDLVLLSDTTGLLTGEENVSVQGVSVAIQRETQRQRQVEFLQSTANPIDMGIIGIKGRGASQRRSDHRARRRRNRTVRRRSRKTPATAARRRRAAGAQPKSGTGDPKWSDAGNAKNNKRLDRRTPGQPGRRPVRPARHPSSPDRWGAVGSSRRFRVWRSGRRHGPDGAPNAGQPAITIVARQYHAD
jgi:hypothetical protein